MLTTVLQAMTGWRVRRYVGRHRARLLITVISTRQRKPDQREAAAAEVSVLELLEPAGSERA